MKVLATEIPEIKIIEPKVFGDSRGFFMETYSAERYQDIGIPNKFVQDNVSVSSKGTLRGLHFQKPNSQGKLVSVLHGEVYDVAVDVRQESPSFGRWVGVYLNHENKRQLWIPAGFAHGFQVTSEKAMFSYKCDAYYNPSTEWTILWNDPDIGIDWPIADPILSAKDQQASRLAELNIQHLPPL